jgi:ribonuclease HI
MENTLASCHNRSEGGKKHRVTSDSGHEPQEVPAVFTCRVLVSFLACYYAPMQSEKLILYSDGGSRGNPGPAGAGAVITDGAGSVIKTVSKFLGVTTNNAAEYQGVILALETVKKLYGKKAREYAIELRMDSQLVASQLSRKYELREESLFPYFIKVWNLQVKDLPPVTFVYIPRESNRLADKLANEAMDAGV